MSAAAVSPFHSASPGDRITLPQDREWFWTVQEVKRTGLIVSAMHSKRFQLHLKTWARLEKDGFIYKPNL